VAVSRGRAAKKQFEHSRPIPPPELESSRRNDNRGCGQARPAALTGSRLARAAAGIAICAIGIGLGGCGLNVSSADLFVLKRSGQGMELTLVVNDGGTIRCNGKSPRALPDDLLLSARNLVTELTKDVQRKLRFPASRRSVFTFTVMMSAGSVTFSDTAAAGHPELAQTELFALQAARGPCRLAV
jgi:hypothetical protein